MFNEVRDSVRSGVREQMLLLAMVVRSGYTLERARGPLDCIFYLLLGQFVKREYSNEGWKVFCSGFSSFYEQFTSTFDLESMEDFYDRFYEFMDGCFPSELDEEVTF